VAAFAGFYHAPSSWRFRGDEFPPILPPVFLAASEFILVSTINNGARTAFASFPVSPGVVERHHPDLLEWSNTAF